MSNEVVWKYLGLAPSQVEMQIRRLQFWQRMVQQQALHCNVLAAVFGHLPCERVPPLQPDGSLPERAHPWLVQLLQDLSALQDIPDTAHIPQAVDGKPLRLFLPEVAADFLYIDVTILRRRFLCANIPPPGLELPAPEVEEAANMEEAGLPTQVPSPGPQ